MLTHQFLQRLKLLGLDDLNQFFRTTPTPVMVSVGAVAAAVTYYLATWPRLLPLPYDLQMQSAEVPVSSSVKMLLSQLNI